MIGKSVNWTYGMGEDGIKPALFCASYFDFHKYSPKLYKKKGFFSEGHPPFQVNTCESYLFLNLMEGVLDFGFTEWNDENLFTEEAGSQPKTYSKRTMSIFDITPLETVNENQWQGHEQIVHKDIKTGVTIWTEPALWSIAAADNSSKERLVFMMTHMGRDKVFRIQNRMQSMIDYALNILDGWENVAMEFRRDSASTIEEMQATDLKEQALEMREDIKRRYKENPLPKWQ